MKIWHVGSSSSPQTVDGINTTVWLVAREQALLGHQVTLLLHSPPDKAAKVSAEEAGNPHPSEYLALRLENARVASLF